MTWCFFGNNLVWLHALAFSFFQTSTTTPTDHSVLEDQIRGLIYGQAIGDAIGLLSEFMIKEEAQRVNKLINHL